MKKISYALGLNIAHNLKSAKINEIDVDSFSKAIADKLLEKEQEITDQEAQQILNDFFTKKEHYKFLIVFIFFKLEIAFFS